MSRTATQRSNKASKAKAWQLELEEYNSDDAPETGAAETAVEQEELQCTWCAGARAPVLHCEGCSKYWCSEDFCLTHQFKTALTQGIHGAGDLALCTGNYRPLIGETVGELSAGTLIG
eukprot:gene15450-18291_t